MPGNQSDGDRTTGANLVFGDGKVYKTATPLLILLHQLRRFPCKNLRSVDWKKIVLINGEHEQPNALSFNYCQGWLTEGLLSLGWWVEEVLVSERNGM